jgi:cell division protein FtsN
MAETAAEQAPVLFETLPSRTYFVQLGAYSTRNLAENLAGDLTRSYSVTILPADSGGRRLYRVLVGPLNVDESGTLLYQFRSRGFKDAFIQYVE